MERKENQGSKIEAMVNLSLAVSAARQSQAVLAFTVITIVFVSNVLRRKSVIKTC